MSEKMFLIEKNGLYYRPDAAGYTGLKHEAGRYSLEEAALHAGPNGPDGPTDGITVWSEKDAPEFASGCCWEARVRRQCFLDGVEAAAKVAEGWYRNAAHGDPATEIRVELGGNS